MSKPYMSKTSWKPRIPLFLTIWAAGFEFTYEDHKKQWSVLKIYIKSQACGKVMIACIYLKMSLR